MNSIDSIDIEKALFEQSFDAIIVANDEGLYVHANDAACKLYGVDREKLIGSHVGGFIDDKNREVVNLQWKAFLEMGEQSGIFDIHRPDGTIQRAAFRARTNFLPGLHVSFLAPLLDFDNSAHKNGERILTICAWSKRVKVDQQWVSIEEFLSNKLQVGISHGISPQSLKKHFA